jgi:hypothetical protein
MRKSYPLTVEAGFVPSYIFIPEMNVEMQTQGNAFCTAVMILIIIKPDGDHSEKGFVCGNFSILMIKYLYGKLALYPGCDPYNWMGAWIFRFSCRRFDPCIACYRSYCHITEGYPG